MRILSFLLIITSGLNYGISQESNLKLSTQYGSDNKELHDLLRFQDIEVMKLEFKGKDLVNKNYRIILKEFSNGSVSKSDTIIDTGEYEYLSSIQDSVFKFKYFVETKSSNNIKMDFLMERFSTERVYNIRASEDKYALHDFLGANPSIPIKLNEPNIIMGYFLPYLDKETGWKKYCEVSDSAFKREEWGRVFDIPNYFLIEIEFF
ncbi:MAG: hypothetical protein AAF688_01885 [Bacteroidota bacterium]